MADHKTTSTRTDIVSRLRDTSTVRSWGAADLQRCEAADAIVELRGEIAALGRHGPMMPLCGDTMRVVTMRECLESLRARVAELERIRKTLSQPVPLKQLADAAPGV